VALIRRVGACGSVSRRYGAAVASASEKRPLALPPAERTVGQLVAESIRFYQERFWQVLPLGLAFAAIEQAQVGHRPYVQAGLLAAGAPLMSAAYVRAASLVTGRPWSWTAFLVGVLLFVPVPALTLVFIFPAVLWLAFMGLAVPVAVAERTRFRRSLIRGRQLGTADYVHSLAGMATLVLVFALTKLMLGILLHGQADATLRTALFLSDLALSPLLFVGAAILYFDQDARLRSTVRSST
jgi:hypothetical protein